MKIDLEKMSREELTELRARIDEALATLAERERLAALEAAEEAAKAHGYSLAELTAVGSTSRRRGKAKASSAANPPKYRHPEDPKKTWSGRGRKPQWIKEAEEAGTLDSLAI